MNWIKDGNTIVANYLGEHVQGIVESSRVKYGGKIQYTVNLNKPVMFRWRTEPTSRVLVDNTEVLQDLGSEIYSPFSTVNS